MSKPLILVSTPPVHYQNRLETNFERFEDRLGQIPAQKKLVMGCGILDVCMIIMTNLEKIDQLPKIVGV